VGETAVAECVSWENKIGFDRWAVGFGSWLEPLSPSLSLWACIGGAGGLVHVMGADPQCAFHESNS